MKLKVGIIRDDRCLEHRTGIIHPEHPNRLKYVYSMIDAEFSREVVYIKPQPVTVADLEVVHTPAYVNKVEVWYTTRGSCWDFLREISWHCRTSPFSTTNLDNPESTNLHNLRIMVISLSP